MKLKSVFAISIAISLISSSCKKDFLNTPPTEGIESTSFIESLRLDGCKQLLNGAYLELGQNFFHGLNFVYPDLIADNLKRTTTAPAFNQHYVWDQVVSQGTASVPSITATTDMNPLWLSGYRILRNLGYVTENVDRFRSDNPVKADSIKGQALVLRALIHFQLVNVFAQPYKFTSGASHPGIPYVIGPDPTVTVPRGPVGEVYAKIVQDLLDAIAILPANSKTKYHAGGNAAKALLARVFLYMGDYAKARDIAVVLSNAVPIMTANYPGKLFTLEETEAFFQILPNASGVNGASNTTNFAGLYFATGTTQKFLATNDIANIIKERPLDKRNAWFVNQAGSWRVAKYPTAVIAGFPNPANSYYQTVIRSSEMYLTAAECYARLGDEPNAIFYLDQIRKRADATAPVTTATGPALLDSIVKERRKELCFEGQRMFDLLRMGKGVSRIDAPLSQAVNLPFPSNKAIAPIPIREVQILGYQQNDGY